MTAGSRRSKAVSVLCLSWALFSSSASAGVVDPTFFPRNASEVPHESAASSENTAHFLCPLTKTFYNDQDKTAAETILLESLGEGYKGMVAVGEVIRNREKLFSKDADAVCRMPKQFSCWNDPKRAEEFLKRNRLYYFVALLAWKHSKKTSLTSGATDYHADSVRPYWADAYRVAARIGRHIFYVREMV